jgi:murein DD-endopeptidase MepM/ murein hydrolase activator NlpD
VAARSESLSATVARYQDRLTELTDRQEEYRAAMDEMERRSEQIAREITEKQREMALAEGVPYLEWPLKPGSYWISSPFGNRYHPILGQWRLHTGVDLAASSGTTIRAAGDGIVLDAGWMGGYGLTVIIAHTSTVSTLYAHASSVLVSGGQTVSEGQSIARVGSTGWSTGPHLHFEVRVDGEPKDPTKYLPAR